MSDKKLILISEELDIRSRDLQKRQIENDVLQAQVEEYKAKMVVAADMLNVGQEALQFLEDVANSRRGAMKVRIEQIITESLQLIYGTDYAVALTYDVKNNRSFMDIELVLQTKDGEVRRTMNGFGGGVSDCISVPLRLLVLLGSRQTDRVCVLDESYKHVDLERIESVAEFLADIAQRLGIQILLFSHHAAMAEESDAVYDIRDESGRAVLEKTS